MAIVVSVSLLQAGCAKRTTTVPKTSASASKSTSSSGRSSGEAEQILTNVVGMLENPADQQVFVAALEQLNRYFARKADILVPLEVSRRDLLTRQLGAKAAADAGRTTFDTADADYLKNCLFLHTVARSMFREDDSAPAYARRLFEWMIHQVAPVERGFQAEGAPLDTCIRGTANVDEYCWTFIELARQGGMLGVVVAYESEGAISPWLCGVVDREEVYLFDPTVGRPVFVKGTSETDADIATLRQLAENPQLVDQSLPETGVRYPVPPKNRQNFSLLLSLEPAMLSPRMAFLESRLAGVTRAVLTTPFEQWVDRAQTAIGRVKTGKDVRVWLYPAERRIATTGPGFTDLLATTNMLWLRQTPSPRVLQLTGRNKEAIESYILLDNQDMSAVMIDGTLAVQGASVEMRRSTAARFSQDLLYFVGLAKIDVEPRDPSPALPWLDRYLDRYHSYELQPNDLLHWTEFLHRLVDDGADEKKPPSPSRRIWQLLSEPARKAVKQAAAASAPVRAEKEELFRNSRGAEALMKRFSPSRADTDAILAGINDILSRPEFFDAEHFSGTTLPPIIRTMLRERPKGGYPPLMLMALNRAVFDYSFPFEVLLGRNLWKAGALRHKAIVLRAIGNQEAAAKLLSTLPDDLMPIERRHLTALHHSWNSGNH